MALSGLGLVGFVVFHMAGNLQIFIPDGGESINKYAAFLQGLGAAKWVARLGLLAMIFIHIFAAYKLTMRAKRARPMSYKSHKWLAGTYAVRTMRYGGVIVLLFIVYHILHFTIGVNDSQLFTNVNHCTVVAEGLSCDVYNNVINGFRHKGIALFYIAANCFLGLHITHGFWSAFRTMGANNPKWDKHIKMGAIGLGALITIGNCSIPIAIAFFNFGP